jgi:hypothetical protein
VDSEPEENLQTEDDACHHLAYPNMCQVVEAAVLRGVGTVENLDIHLEGNVLEMFEQVYRNYCAS